MTCSLLFSPAVIPDVLLGRKDSLTKTDIGFEEPKVLGWEWAGVGEKDIRNPCSSRAQHTARASVRASCYLCAHLL